MPVYTTPMTVSSTVTMEYIVLFFLVCLKRRV